jgi:hypothetical protein
MATPETVRIRIVWSIGRFWWTAAITPSGTPSTIAIRIENITSSKVFGK